MNRRRIIIRSIGIAIFLFGIGIQYFIENEGYDFWSGACLGVGGVLAITGRIRRRV